MINERKSYLVVIIRYVVVEFSDLMPTDKVSFDFFCFFFPRDESGLNHDQVCSLSVLTCTIKHVTQLFKWFVCFLTAHSLLCGILNSASYVSGGGYINRINNLNNRKTIESCPDRYIVTRIMNERKSYSVIMGYAVTDSN